MIDIFIQLESGINRLILLEIFSNTNTIKTISKKYNLYNLILVNITYKEANQIYLKNKDKIKYFANNELNLEIRETDEKVSTYLQKSTLQKLSGRTIDNKEITYYRITKNTNSSIDIEKCNTIAGCFTFKQLFQAMHYILEQRTTFNNTKGKQGIMITALECPFETKALNSTKTIWSSLIKSLDAAGVLVVFPVKNKDKVLLKTEHQINVIIDSTTDIINIRQNTLIAKSSSQICWLIAALYSVVNESEINNIYQNPVVITKKIRNTIINSSDHYYLNMTKTIENFRKIQTQTQIILQPKTYNHINDTFNSTFYGVVLSCTLFFIESGFENFLHKIKFTAITALIGFILTYILSGYIYMNTINIAIIFSSTFIAALQRYQQGRF